MSRVQSHWEKFLPSEKMAPEKLGLLSVVGDAKRSDYHSIESEEGVPPSSAPLGLTDYSANPSTLEWKSVRAHPIGQPDGTGVERGPS